jgi:hypothetical protein
MLAYCGSRISKHMAVMRNGALVCLGVPLARVGEQEYKGSELGLPTDDIVTVVRPPDEVFNPAALASFEGVPLCDKHPGTFITPSNFSWYTRGHVQNIRRSADGESVLGDVIVNDESLIAKIKAGTRDISCGYETEYIRLRDGRYMQTVIRGNHVAVVEVGRASTTKIMDAGEQDMDAEVEKRLDRLVTAVEKFVERRPSPAMDAKRTLADEVERIRRDAQKTESLTKSGIGPATFAEALRQYSGAYDDFSRGEEAARSFEAECRAAGQKMQARFPSSARVCTDSLPGKPHGQAEAEDWAESMNRRGRALRGRGR